jgi:hypothetical protein
MSNQYRLVQSGKTASGGCSASQGSSEPVAPRIPTVHQNKRRMKENQYFVNYSISPASAFVNTFFIYHIS